MADRTIVLAQNKRHAVRGLTVVNPQEFAAVQEQDDNLTYIIDMSSYLDGATISSVTRTATGVTVSNTSNTTTRLTQRLKGFGYVDFKVTTSSGDVEEFRLVIQQRASSSLQQIAQVPDPMPVAYTEARDPTNADDTIDGYVAGHVWINTVSQNVFDCISNAQGAAIWRHRPRVWQAGGLSYTGGTNEVVLATITIPAGTLGALGRVSIESQWGATNNANNKISRIRFSGLSGTEFFTLTANSYASFAIEKVIQNITASSQVGNIAGNGTAGGYGVVTGVTTTATVDTSAETQLVFTAQLATGSDTINLHSYKVTLTRPDIT